TAARVAGSGTLQGTTSGTAAGGLVTFTNLSHTVATNITIQFSNGVLGSATSGVVSISPAAAIQLSFFVQPGSGTAGALLGSQPVVHTRDQFGNDSIVGLAASKIISLALSSGSGP